MDAKPSLFEYVFYRIYCFFRQQGDSIPATKGSSLVSLIQFFTIIDLMVIVKLFYDYPFPTKFYFLPLLLLLGITNWYKYERNLELEHMKQLYGSEEAMQKRRNGWLIAGYLVFSFLIPAVYGYLHVNMKLI